MPKQTATNVSQKPWGIPGEEHQLWVVPLKAGQQPPTNLTGAPGKYKVQLLLSRPGYPLTAEREHKFIDDVIGDSHVAITKPVKERKVEDAVIILLQASGHGQQITFKGLPNDNGYLGKLIVEELDASGFHEAEDRAYQVIAPFLSAWSLHLDIPMHVETIQVTDLQTHTNSLRVRTPPFEMTFAGGFLCGTPVAFAARQESVEVHLAGLLPVDALSGKTSHEVRYPLEGRGVDFLVAAAVDAAAKVAQHLTLFVTGCLIFLRPTHPHEVELVLEGEHVMSHVPSLMLGELLDVALGEFPVSQGSPPRSPRTRRS